MNRSRTARSSRSDHEPIRSAILRSPEPATPKRWQVIRQAGWTTALVSGDGVTRSVPQRAPSDPGDRFALQGMAGNRVVQRLVGRDAAREPSPINLKGSCQGRPMPAELRRKMESYFATDFADVRIHLGAEPLAIGAAAFALGSEVHLAPEHYNPQTLHGQRIIGHELAHVTQQRRGRVPHPSTCGVAVVQDSFLEAEADRLGTAAAAHALPAHPGESASPCCRTDPAGLTSAGARGAGVLQPAELRKGSLNVIGEDHDVSNGRRSQEKAVVKALLDLGAFDYYWLEGEFKEKDFKFGTWRSPADPPGKRLEFLAHRLLGNLRGLSESISSADPTARTDWVRKWDTFVIPLMRDASAEASAAGFSAKADAIDEYYRGDRFPKINYSHSPAAVKAATDRVYTMVLSILGVTLPPGARHSDLAKSSSLDRSRAMHDAANRRKSTKGVWKIGNGHVEDIQAHAGRDWPTVEYSLMDKDDFETILRSAAST